MDDFDRATFSRTMAGVAVALTLLAGYVDAIGYLTLGHVYVANMSGNSIAIGIQTSQAQLAQVWHFAWPVMSFTTGLFVSRLMVSWGLNSGWRSVAAPAIALEAVALGGFIVIPGGAAGVFLAGCAMGIQAATLSRFNRVTVYTCFVTGSLVKFAEHGAELVIECLRRGEARARHGRGAIWFALIWGAYVIGAILGATAIDRLSRVSIMIAVGCLVMLAIVDLWSPASLEKSVP